VRLAKLPIGVLTTLLFGQLNHPRTGSSIKQLGLRAKLHNHQSSPVTQNYHCDSLKTCFSNCKAAIATIITTSQATDTAATITMHSACYTFEEGE
jgi:hypothetical protein